MLVVAGVGRDDVLFDLGSGDGRMLVAAAKRSGVKAVGFEIDPALVQLSREIIERENLAGLVQVRLQDFMTAELSSATVVTLYLSQDGNAALKPLLLRQLRPGARVVPTPSIWATGGRRPPNSTATPPAISTLSTSGASRRGLNAAMPIDRGGQPFL